jgi:hypothetical protein
VTQAADVDFDVPVTGARRRGRKPKPTTKEVMPSRPQSTGVTTGAERTVQTAPTPVSRETNEIEAELARRRAAKPAFHSVPVEEMSEAELEAELARRRGLPPPEAPPVVNGQASPTARLNGSPEEPPPGVVNSPLGDFAPRHVAFSANPQAEMQRLLTMDHEEARARSRRPEPVAQPVFEPVSAPPLPKPQVDEQGNLVRQDTPDTPFRPLRPVDIQQVDQVTWYELELPGGGRVRVPATAMVPVSEAPAAPGSQAPNFRCMIEGTNIVRGCPDFYLDRRSIVAGSYPRCPTCQGRALLPLD